ncbi:DoxX family protein [Ulvibacterium sp.]|uniref:DoxX family protein n=1 Tax=Ulvibacterium sp. TaxID=2665914 RepID=UPI003CC68758
MKTLIVLLGTFLISLILIKFIKGQLSLALAAQIAMAAMLVFTAIGHFAFTHGMAQMLPDFIPAKKELVYFTGFMEIGFAIGLLMPRYKVTVAWVLIVFFILILPANIKAALENINYQTGELNGKGISYLWFRIPLQLFFILWVYFSTLKK